MPRAAPGYPIYLPGSPNDDWFSEIVSPGTRTATRWSSGTRGWRGPANIFWPPKGLRVDTIRSDLYPADDHPVQLATDAIYDSALDPLGWSAAFDGINVSLGEFGLPGVATTGFSLDGGIGYLARAIIIRRDGWNENGILPSPAAVLAAWELAALAYSHIAGIVIEMDVDGDTDPPLATAVPAVLGSAAAGFEYHVVPVAGGTGSGMIPTDADYRDAINIAAGLYATWLTTAIV